MKKSHFSGCRKLLHKKRTVSAKKQSHPFKNLLKAGLITAIVLAGCKKVDEPENSISAFTGKGAGNKIATEEATGDEFTIAVIPDTQFYMGEDEKGGTREMFYKQIEWIKANRETENIVYVAGLGDISSCGDKSNVNTGTNSKTTQWNIAANATQGYYALEDPLPNLPHGIPYGVTVGNHDQFRDSGPEGPFTSPTTKFNEKFGEDHFQNFGYYGWHFTGDEINSNDNHYDNFTAGGMNFRVIHIEYDDIDDPATQQFQDVNGEIIQWAYDKALAVPNSKVIIVTHSAVKNGKWANFTPQGARIYNKLRSLPNVFMMLGGHVGNNGEGYRQRTFNGSTLKAYLSNYQSRDFGGNGLMRLYTISKSSDRVRVRTINPYTGLSETDEDSQFIRTLFHEPTACRTLDFDNNSTSQLAIFNSGLWNVNGMSSSVNFGTSQDIAIPADYTGDGQADYAIWSPGNFQIQGQSANWGTTGDIPVPGDYEDNDLDNTDDTEGMKEKADGLADFAVYRPSDGTWYVKGVSYGVWGGNSSDIPVPADYDGDGRLDLAYFRSSNGTWYVKGETAVTFGTTAGDIPLPGDYNGDGFADLAFFRRSTKVWQIKNQTNVTLTSYVAGDIPAPGDYNGDGKTDPALYRPSTGELFINGQPTIATGLTNGKPLNLPYHIRKFFFP